MGRDEPCQRAETEHGGSLKTIDQDEKCYGSSGTRKTRLLANTCHLPLIASLYGLFFIPQVQEMTHRMWRQKRNQTKLVGSHRRKW